METKNNESVLGKFRDSKKIRFLRTLLQNPAQVGAIWPSSAQLSRAMVSNLVFRPGDGVVELGPGSGTITRAILNSLPQTDQYRGIELSQHFLKLLQKEFPQAIFINGDARHLASMIADHLHLPVRYVFSSLPFAVQDEETQLRILQSIHHCLEPGGLFRTYQYVTSWWLPGAQRFREIASSYFRLIRPSALVLGNLPPAFVLTWHKPGVPATPPTAPP